MRPRKHLFKNIHNRKSWSSQSVFLSEDHVAPPTAVSFVDTHVHTRFSDGGATIQQVEEVCRELEIGCLIADHNEIRGSIKLLDRMKVPTLPSMEVGSREQIDLLMYFRSAEEAEIFFRLHVEPYRL